MKGAMKREYESGDKVLEASHSSGCARSHIPHLPQGFVVRAALKVPQGIDYTPNRQAAVRRLAISVRSLQRVCIFEGMKNREPALTCSLLHNSSDQQACRPEESGFASSRFSYRYLLKPVKVEEKSNQERT